MYTKVILKHNMKLASVYESEAVSLIEKGLAYWPDQIPEQKVINPKENNSIQSSPESKKGRPKKNATN